MTQQQFINEFRSYPKAQKSVVIRQLLRMFEEEFERRNARRQGTFNRRKEGNC